MAFLEIVENYTPIIINISIIILLLFARFLRKREKESMKDNFFDSPKTLTDLIRIPECDFGQVIDTKNSIVTGKGYGYESWVKKHNLKQIAKTVLFLQQNSINDYDELAEKAAAVSEKSHKIADEIKAMEQRMKEISILEKHIINYAKTRETYAEYRKAGYSKAFRAEHDHEIRLCQEAKEYFGSLGLEKLPTMKMLKAEYAELLEKKNALYPEYKKAREQSKELLSAKANLELFFGYGDMAKETKQKIYMMSK